MGSCARPMRSQPDSLSIRHRVAAKGVFPGKSSPFYHCQTLPEVSGFFALTSSVRHFARQRNCKAQAILPVAQLGISSQPIPIHIQIRQRYGKEMEDCSVVPYIVSRGLKVDLRDVSNNPLHMVREFRQAFDLRR